MTIYSITLKLNHNGPTQDEYDDLLNKLFNEFGILVEKLTYEVDSKQNLHIHGIFTKCTKISYRAIARFLKCHVFITDLSDVKDYRKWVNYLKKQKSQEKDNLVLNPYLKQYMFQDIVKEDNLVRSITPPEEATSCSS